MILQWTTRDTFFSRLISKILKGPSHFSILFENYGVVVHSVIPNVTIEPEGYFNSRNITVRSLRYVGDLDTEVAWVDALNSYYHKPYDFGLLVFGLLALSVRFIRKVFDRNMWSAKKAFSCHELIAIIKDNGYAPDVEIPDDVDNYTLMELFNILRNSKFWVEER